MGYGGQGMGTNYNPNMGGWWNDLSKINLKYWLELALSYCRPLYGSI